MGKGKGAKEWAREELWAGGEFRGGNGRGRSLRPERGFLKDSSTWQSSGVSRKQWKRILRAGPQQQIPSSGILALLFWAVKTVWSLPASLSLTSSFSPNLPLTLSLAGSPACSGGTSCLSVAGRRQGQQGDKGTGGKTPLGEAGGSTRDNVTGPLTAIHFSRLCLHQ